MQKYVIKCKNAKMQEKCIKMQKNAKKMQETQKRLAMQSNTKMQTNANKHKICKRVQKNAKECKRIQKNAKGRRRLQRRTTKNAK